MIQFFFNVEKKSILKDPLLLEFLDLPDYVIKWYERMVFVAHYEQGKPYNFIVYWSSLSDHEKRKTIAYLIKEAFGEQPCPKASLAKRDAALGTPSLQKKSDRDCVPVNDSSVFTGDIIGEIAATDLHILIATKTGAGKSTTLKAVIYRISQDNPSAKFAIIDPKTTDWLGLQRSTNCVTYLEQDTTSEQLDAALSSIEKIFGILQSRKNQKQQALKNDRDIPKFNSQYLIIDEWFSIYDSIKRQKREDSFMEPLNQIAAQGRELKVHLILVGQSHLCGEIGFSTAMRRSFAVLAQGRMGENRDVGYEPIAATIEDPNMFRNKSERTALMRSFQEAIAIAQNRDDRPVLLTTMGVPKIALLPDLKYIETITM